MAKTYNSNWKTQRLEINFNQKQWRQDFGAFIREKLFWDGKTRVSRSRAKTKGPNLITKGIKTFEIYNSYSSVIVEYQNNNEVLYTTHEELVKEYFKERGLK